MGDGSNWFEWLLGAALLLCAAGWGLCAARARSRMERVLHAIDALTEEGSRQTALGALGLERSLDGAIHRIDKLARHQESLLQRIEHDEFSLRTVLASMEEGVLVVDARQTIRLANPAFLSGFGLARSPIDRSVLEVLGEPDVHRLLKEVLEKGESRERNLEMVPGKKVRFVTVRAVPMSDVKGRPGVLAVFRDQTRLQKLEQVRREFVANVSHELRTPLSIFQGYVETLVDMPEMTEAERLEVYATLLRHSRRLNALVDDLLLIARLEARREVLEWELRALAPLVQKIVSDWSPRAEARGVQTEVRAAEDSALVRLDHTRIEQVLFNLLDNALKHSPENGGRIAVHVQPDGDGWLRVIVEDNGSGIAAKDLPHIFERFYRADKARGYAGASNGDAHSTGLGLSIVKHLITAHGGEVGAESTPGKGARVWFRLPVVSAPG